MSTQHRSVHTFLKRLKSDMSARLNSKTHHTGVSCDGCSKKSFSGKRYQCEQCPPSYDLCEDCYGKIHTAFLIMCQQSRDAQWKNFGFSRKN